MARTSKQPRGRKSPKTTDEMTAEAGETEAAVAVVDPEVDMESEETPGEDLLEEPLEAAGEMEEEPATLVDGDLTALIKTPLGLRGAIEALLFVSPDPLTSRRIGNVLDLRDSRLILATLKQMQADYDDQRRGLQLQETAEGFRLATREMFGDLILRLKGRRRRPALSPTALETLAIVAYRQPIIRAEVEAVRGVESSGTIRNLIDMGLVEMVGRKDVLGRPPMYGTTVKFLQAFGLKSLQDLPAIGDLKRQYIENEKIADAAEQEALAAEHEEQMRRRLEAVEAAKNADEEEDEDVEEVAAEGAVAVEASDAGDEFGDEDDDSDEDEDDDGDEDSLDEDDADEDEDDDGDDDDDDDDDDGDDEDDDE
jgi:segregation and condensation protein B